MAGRIESIAYCTNVHAGADLASARANLEKYSCRTREYFFGSKSPSAGRLGVGLWLADEAAQQALQSNQLPAFRDWLVEKNLRVFTMNGFPQGNFHQPVVKHNVYLPTWWSPSRLAYTRSLVTILQHLIEPEEIGSISTLPLGWSVPSPSHEQLVQAAMHFACLAEELSRLLEETGKEIVIAIEPEPGCQLGDSASLRRFFREYLGQVANAEQVRKHITVCHDICHAAVMREDQRKELEAYREEGMRVGKVQVSSAIHIDWSSLDLEGKRRAWAQLASFAEDRYLHQTTISSKSGIEWVEDLPQLLARVQDLAELSGVWRVHFHVPIFASELGALQTTQDEIRVCLDFMKAIPKESSFFTGHWEVETYAWSVLPREFAPSDLAVGIAEELLWFEKQR